jgi:antitoxin component YwqK of YwqJK toxin-antitoxin module
MVMRKLDENYSNGQAVSKQDGDTLTYYFEDGTVKAQGPYRESVMQGEWIFNKKEGYQWQVGRFDDLGQKHGAWERYNPDHSLQTRQEFEHGVRQK